MFLDTKTKAERALANAELTKELEELEELESQRPCSTRRTFLKRAGRVAAAAAASSVVIPSGFTAIMLSQPQPTDLPTPHGHNRRPGEGATNLPSAHCKATEPAEKLIIVPQADVSKMP